MFEDASYIWREFILNSVDSIRSVSLQNSTLLTRDFLGFQVVDGSPQSRWFSLQIFIENHVKICVAYTFPTSKREGEACVG